LADLVPGLRVAQQGIGDYFKHLQETQRERDEVARFLRRWEGSAFEFLVSLLSNRSSRALISP
jgi:hypothetical protein